jgi:hypothetical protein
MLDTAEEKLKRIADVCNDELSQRTYHAGWGIKEWLEYIRAIALSKNAASTDSAIPFEY